jgi:hypothetical protein
MASTSSWDYYGEPDPFERLAATSSFFRIADAAYERVGALPAYGDNIQLIPLEPGGKRPAKGFLPSRHAGPTTRETLALLAASHPDANVGINSHGAVGSLTVMDCDEPGVAERYERETGRQLPLTFTTQTRPQSAPWKMNLYYMSTEHSVRSLPKQVTDVTHICGYDLKGNGGWGNVGAAGNVRDGERIVVLHDVPIAPVPDDLVDWWVADVAKGRSQKRKLARKKPEPAQPETTSPRPFAVARGDRHWTMRSRIRTCKNLGWNDEETFALVSSDIRECFEGGDDYLRRLNLRALVRRVPTIGRHASYRILTHRRRTHRSAIKLAALRERFKSCPLDISPADARIFFSVRNRADHERLRREFHRHGYVYVGSQGSHAGIWSRRPAAPNFIPLKKASLSIDFAFSMDRFMEGGSGGAPQHSKVCMRSEVALDQQVAHDPFIHTRYVKDTGKNGGDRA